MNSSLWVTEMILPSSMDANEPVFESKETQASELGVNFLLHDTEYGITGKKKQEAFFYFLTSQ